MANNLRSWGKEISNVSVEAVVRAVEAVVRAVEAIVA